MKKYDIMYMSKKRLTGKKISNRFLKVEQNACQTVGFSVRYQMFTMNAEA